MPFQCTVCASPSREAAERDLINGLSMRAVAKRYALGYSSVHRHWTGGHMNGRMAAAATRAKQTDVREASGLLDALTDVVAQLQRFLDAVDRELRDPDDASRYYLGPRSDDVQVVYTRDDGLGHPVRAKARLSALIETAERGGITAYDVNIKSADIRDLLVRAADSMGRQLRILAEVQGLIASKVEVKVNVLQYMPRVLAILGRFPDALAALRAELARPAVEVGAVPQLMVGPTAPPEARADATPADEVRGAPNVEGAGGTAGGPRALSRSPEGWSVSCTAGGPVEEVRGTPIPPLHTHDSPPLLKVPPLSQSKGGGKVKGSGSVSTK